MKTITLTGESVYTGIIKTFTRGTVGHSIYSYSTYKFGNSHVSVPKNDTFFDYYDDLNIHTVTIEEYVDEKGDNKFRILSYLTNEQHLSVLRNKMEEERILNS